MTGSVLNIIIKLIAVVLAIFLWFNVITQKQYEHELTLEITEIELQPSLGAVTPFPDSLAVRVMAEGKKLLRDDWKDAGLRIKAGRLNRGISELELNLETVALVRPEDVSLLEIPGAAPITVQLDRLDTLLRPVASKLAVIPAEGYMIISGRGGVTPLQTQVVGPGLLINRIDSIFTEQRIIDDVEEPLQLTLALKIPPDMDIDLGHDSATIDIDIDKIKRKRFEGIEVSIVDGRGGNVIVDPDRITVDINGPASLIDSLQQSQIRVEANLPRGVKNAYVVPRINLPSNFETTAIIPDSVRILVSP